MSAAWLRLAQPLRMLRWPPSDRRLFFEALRTATAVEIDLRLRRFPRLFRQSRASLSAPAAPREVAAPAVRLAIRRAYRALPFEPTCLRESLVFCLMFARRGLPAELRLGVKKTGESLGAHAWVEDETGAVLTEELEKFIPLPLPGPDPLTLPTPPIRP
jgi:hypothetical protein